MITIHGKRFVPYLSKEEIDASLDAMARAMSADLRGKNPLFIAILNGAFVFASDLVRRFDFECEISFVKFASYSGTKSTGKVLTMIGLDAEVAGRTVVILEDIIDTGKTMNEFLPKLRAQNPTEVKLAALLYKPAASQFNIRPDYTGFEIPNDFVVGYGLDYDGAGRNLPFLYRVFET